ncbi:MAG: R2-like ligand-binding oxidase [Chloroflexota bacterium]|nr:R2-like ligand-binding oxidase [Chloroflexota bacterium]
MTLIHSGFATIRRGLQRESPPMRLFEKAKRFGIWNPSDIDFTQDKADWARLRDDERDVILRLTALFQGGEEAVTLDLLPLMMTIAQEGRIEEEMFLTTFLWEEAKHVDFFRRFLDEVTGEPGDLRRYTSPAYSAIFHDALPTALNRLLSDATPAAQLQASITYNMIVEGVLAETGYHAYYTMLERNGIMPGQIGGIRLLKQDESRHIAYGIYLISRLIAADPTLWELADTTMTTLLPSALGVVTEVFSYYDPVPFGLQIDEFLAYAAMQYQKRYARLLAARGASLDEVARVTTNAIENDDA